MRSVLIIIILLFIGLASHAQNANLQVIHASADTSLSDVDVWLNNLKIADNLNFNEATALIEIPANQVFDLRVSVSSSIDTTSPLLLYTDSLATSENMAFMISGLLDPAGYSNFQPLAMTPIGVFQSVANVSGNTAFKYVNACTDLGSITITENKEGLGVLFSQIPYADNSGIAEQTTSNYRFELTSSASEVIREFDVDFADANLQDSALILLNTGFKNPLINNEGSPLNLIGVLPNGDVIDFPQSEARIQFIHNSADSSIFRIDVYIDGSKKLDNFQFRASTGFLSLPSGKPTTIAIAPDSSLDLGDTIFSTEIGLEAGKSYVAIAAGNASTGFSPEAPLNLYIHPARPEALIGSNVDVLFFNGSTDAGEVRIFESSAIKNNIVSPNNFSEFDSYTSLPFTDYKLDLISENDNSILATYDFILSLYNLEGESLTLMTSGFLDSSANKNGPPLGLWFARSQSGLMIELPLAVGIEKSDNARPNVRIFPQPTKDELIIKSSISIEHIEIYTLHGQIIHEQSFSDNTARIRTSNLPTGTYFISLKHQTGIIHRTFQVRQ